ncbi:SH3 domain-containing protein [Flavobacterium sp. JP2137]|uniref:SH3 domain-containing protein n=1 Tax=Flavobacterium sp. JP2137 TaxID=3414510 RepID=UPI003D2FD3C4
MSLQEKYARLIQEAQAQSIRNLQVREQDAVLYIDGEASTGEVKDKLWSSYNEIDPDFRSGDLILNIQVSVDPQATKLRVSTAHGNLNIRKGPGKDQELLGKSAHNAAVTLLSKYNSEWYLIRNEQGIEGYSSSQYLTQL